MLDVRSLCPSCMEKLENTIMNAGKCPYCGYCPDTYEQNHRCLPVHTILAGKYLVGTVLGQGGFGITYIGYDLNMETRIAIKEYFPVELVSRDTTTMHGDRVLSLSGEKSVTYQQGLKKYVAEAQSVSRFSDVPGVVSVKDFFYENETAYIVMEYIEGQSLKDYLKEQGGKLSEEETLRIMKPVLEALVKVHEAGIVHRDISPDNIMLTFEDENTSHKNTSHNGGSASTIRRIKDVKLIDFGAARMTAKNDQKSLTIILKHGYAPEEQYRTHGEQGSWTDVYAICAVMYRMLTGVTPVPAMDRLFKDDLKNFGELGIKVSQNTADAILKGLAVKKDDRIQSMQELIAVLYEGKKVKKSKTSGFWNVKTISAISAAGIVILIAAGTFLSKPAANNESFSESSNTVVSDAIPDDLPAEEYTNAEEILSTEAAEEELGEVIVTATPQTSYDGSASHVVILLDDGTVTSLGSNSYGQRNLSEWTRIAAVAAGDTFSAGLREDGKVLVEGELIGKEDVERWTNIIAISAADRHLYGLTADGTLVCNLVDKTNEAFTEWTDVKSISAAPYTFSVLTNDGQVFSTRLSDHTPSEISGWTDVKFIDCSQVNVFGVKEDGTVIHSYMWTDYQPEIAGNKIETFQNIVQLYVDHRSFYGVSEDGTLYIGREKEKYSSTESQNDILQEMDSWNNLAGIVGTAMGEGRIAGVQKDGTILKTSNNYGNTDIADMQNLEKVKIFNGDQRPVVSGITKNHQLLYYSFLDRSFSESASIKDLMQLSYYDSKNSSSWGYAYMDTNGDLFMQDPHEVKVSFHSVDSSLMQISCVAGINSHDVYIAGLKEDGTIRLYQPGYYEVPEALHEAEGWTNISQIALCESKDQSCLLALKNDGTILALKSDGTVPEAVSGWKDIVSLHEGTYAIGAIRSDGTAVFMEDDPEYNYGQYNTSGWTDLTQLALGLYHTAGLRSDGTVYATGRNDAGQCDVEDWTDIVYIAAGESCTLGIHEDGSLVIAGDVGW